MLVSLSLNNTAIKDYRAVSINTILLAVLAFCLPAPSSAEDVILQMAKVQNDPAAQYFLGRRYLNGNGVTKNDAQAANWFLKAAKQGHMNAQYEAGLLYKNGMGVNKDYQAAFEHFLRSSEQGHPGAMYELGNYYFFGLDGPTDTAQALIWYRNAAEKNHGAGQYQLGKILKEGIGVKANREEGQKWLDIARGNGVNLDIDVAKLYSSNIKTQSSNSSLSTSGILADIREEDVDAQFSIGMRYLNGKGGIKQPEIAAQWLREAARSEHAGAQFELGKMYLNGNGVEKSDGEAIKWLRKAANWGLPNAKTALNKLLDAQLVSYIKDYPSGPDIKKPDLQYKIGVFYLSGKGLKKNPKKAADWMIKSARNEYPKAQYKTGIMYKDGVGFNKNLVKAKYWLEKATENGITGAGEALHALKNAKQDNSKNSVRLSLTTLEKEAQTGDSAKQYRAGISFLTGKGAEKDVEKSIQWLTLSADQGYIDAQKQLAMIYTNGEVIDRDLSIAASWLKKAAEAGDADAQYALGNIYKKGIGVDKNNSLAVKWYRVAARQGHSDARSKLGCKIC